jgi:hypothetical protein
MTPIFIDLDIIFKEDLGFKEFFHVDAGLTTNALEHFTATANDNASLRIALDNDVGPNSSKESLSDNG